MKFDRRPLVSVAADVLLASGLVPPLLEVGCRLGLLLVRMLLRKLLLPLSRPQLLKLQHLLQKQQQNLLRKNLQKKQLQTSLAKR